MSLSVPDYKVKAGRGALWAPGKGLGFTTEGQVSPSYSKFACNRVLLPPESILLNST